MPETPIILNQQRSIFNQYLTELRDETLQKDRLRFRTNMSRAAEVLGYELSKHLAYEQRETNTPLGSCESFTLKEQPVLATILRAGLAMQEGLLRVFDKADNAFVSAYRHHTSDNEFVIKIEYISTTDLTGRTLILLDPMIATGQSMVLSHEALLQSGQPARTLILSLIASEQGLDYVQRHIPSAEIFLGALDSELTAKSYIVPGLGDAGDLAFGKKSVDTEDLDEDDTDEPADNPHPTTDLD